MRADPFAPDPLELDVAARSAHAALVLGNGGGSDCFFAALAADHLRRLGVERVLVGGIGCQWWPEPGWTESDLVQVLGPELYDPSTLSGATPVGAHAVLIGPDARNPDGHVPHEAVVAEHLGGESFVVSLTGGARGAADGLAAIVEHFGADLVVNVDVGSDSLSTGHEVRPVETALADHLALVALAAQDVPRFFALSGYGGDAELELEELDANFATIVHAGGLRGGFVPSAAAIADLDALLAARGDPVGAVVAKAYRGEFGLHRLRKTSPWGETVRLTPAAIPVWVMDPAVVVNDVASDAAQLLGTMSAAEAEAAYVAAGRLPETSVARMVDFRRP